MKLKIALLAGVAGLMLPAGAYAAGCTPTLTPVSGDTVSCSGTETGTIAAAVGSSNVTVNIDSTGILTSAHPIDALYIDSTVNNDGQILGAATGGDSIVVRDGGFTLNNTGTIDFTGNTSTFSVTNAVNLIQDADGAHITNSGTISSTAGLTASGVFSDYDVSVANTSLIKATGANSMAVHGSEGSSIVNSGIIRAVGTASFGTVTAIDLTGTLGAGPAGATITNQAGGVIEALMGGNSTDPLLAIKTGAGNDTVTNAGTINGGADLGDGDDLLVVQANGILTTGTWSGGNGNDTFRIDGTTAGSVSVGTSFYDFEVSEKTGTGAITYSGNSTFNDFFVRAGALTVGANSELDAATLTVQSGATLTGIGTIGATAINVQSGGTLNGTGTFDAGTINFASGGIVAPGQSIGDLSVIGNMNFASGSIFAVEVTPTTADHLGVTGNVIITSGAQIRVTTANQTTDFSPTTTYRVLDTSGTVSGNFTPLALAFFDVSVANVGNGIDLTLDRNSADLVDVAMTSNQQAVAASLQPGCTTAPAGGDLLDVCNALLLSTTPEVQAALDSFSGAGLSQFPAMAIDAVTLIGQSLDQRFRRGYHPKTNPESVRFFIDGLDSNVTIDGSTAAPGLDADHMGVVIGEESALNQDVTLGFHAGYVQSDADASSPSPVNFSANTFLVGAHAVFDNGPVWAQLRAAWAMTDGDSTRSVAYSGTTRTATATPQTQFIVAAADIAHRFNLYGFELTPELSGQYIYADTTDYSETGADSLDLTIEDQKLNVGHIDLVGTVAYPFGMVTPYATLGARQLLGDKDPELRGSLSGLTPFSVAGEGGGDLNGVIGAGIEGYVGPVHVFAQYEGLVGGDTDAQGGRLGIKVDF